MFLYLCQINIIFSLRQTVCLNVKRENMAVIRDQGWRFSLATMSMTSGYFNREQKTQKNFPVAQLPAY